MNKNVIDAQYNLTEALGLAKTGTDFLVGFNTKQYQFISTLGQSLLTPQANFAIGDLPDF